MVALMGVRMSREELVKAIYDSCADWTCPDNHSCERIEDGSPAVLCMQCADKLFKEYEDKIRADGYHKAESDYFAKTQKDREDAYNCGYETGRADAINEFLEKIEEHQQNNWIDNLEYGITFADLENVAGKLKEQKDGNSNI